MFPSTHSPRIAACYTRLAALDRRRHDLLSDPMVEASGCPVADFMEDYDREERKALSDLIAAAITDHDTEARNFAFDRMERWMP